MKPHCFCSRIADALGEIRRRYAEQALRDKLIDHKEYIRRVGDDMPEIKDWVWGGQGRAQETASTGAYNPEG